MSQSDSSSSQAVTVMPATPLVPPPPVPVIPANIAYSVVYTDGTFLTSALMNQAQNYLIKWLQLQNQLLYTTGVLNGLQVSHPSGNALAVSGGAGFDEQGRFVVLPDNSGALTVPTTAANPCYVGISYPPPPPPGPSNVHDMAGVLAYADTINGLPQYSLLLAEIAMANGTITGVTDRRTPVDTRLPANLGVTPEAPQALRANRMMIRNGQILVPIGGLRQQGDRQLVPVSFSEPHLPPPPFKQPPRVMVTVIGDNPYATATSNITLTGFDLTLTAILPPTPGVTQLVVEWLAYE